MKKILRLLPLGILVLAALLIVCPSKSAKAASKITIDTIDYENLTMKIHKNGNGIIKYSTDNKKTWKEVDAKVFGSGSSEYILFDIAWVPATAVTTVYFKGDKVETVETVKFPKQSTSLKIKYDKAENDFTFQGCDDVTTFMWRKTSNYNWKTVYLPTSKNLGEAGVMSYESFRKEVEKLLVKGGKIAIRTGQTNPATNTANEPGERPSKEVTISVSKRANAPNIRLNITKLTLNTKDTYEYKVGDSWKSCTKTMDLEELAPDVFYDKTAGTAGNSITIRFRTAATDKKSYSKTCFVYIPGQGAAPTIGDDSADVTAYTSDGKLNLRFNKATKDRPYEYCIFKDGTDIEDAERISWKTVKTNKAVKFSAKQAPAGAKIYVRTKGVNINVNKGIDYKLPSAYALYTVN